MPHLLTIAVSILFDGLAYAMFLFITSVGLSVTMGLMGFVNLAHGAFAMAGGYIVVSLTRSLGIDFVPSLLISAVVIAVASVPFERGLYRRLYKSTDLEQVLLTIGLAFMAIAAFTYFYGPIPKSVPLPSWLEGDINLGFRSFPSYRAFLILIGAILITILWYAFERTNIGAKIRAAVDNRRMAESVGINVDRLFTLTFALGSGLAALGGGFAIQLFGLTPYFAVLYLVLFLIVVAVGGLGSLKGTLLAALVIGIIDTGGKYMFPQAGNFFIYAITVIVLLIKPAGFYGRE
ncbi:MAG TPA: branched-chain amino acid ABC transporter permease [Pseudolabrys sp.]|nr:branched-chain amino acid ABC transporter permease [Pseudolabrys sp.]